LLVFAFIHFFQFILVGRSTILTLGDSLLPKASGNKTATSILFIVHFKIFQSRFGDTELVISDLFINLFQ